MSRQSLFKRFSSTFTTKPTPSKNHLHGPLPDSLFPKGYLLTGIHVGVKKDNTGPDLALILSTSPYPTSAAACFTRNSFQAAPVLVSQQVLADNAGRARAVVVNSGCANAVTGKQGMQDAWDMVKETDALVVGSQGTLQEKEEKSETLVMSTGVIGQHLPIANIIQGIRSQASGSSTTQLGSGFEAWERAARAFMTTDTFPKLRARAFTIGGKEYHLAGMDKGAGMIHPNMGPASTSVPPSLHATLLGCILTDAAVSPHSLQSALTYAVDRSFNSISVDGDMSTNDTIILLANGAAAGSPNLGHKSAAGKVPEIDEENDGESYEIFRDELTALAVDLAKLVVRDGEGATKFVTVTVEGAPTYQDAHKIASKISTSALVKTALYGEDANWGRVLSSTGSVSLSIPLDPSRVSVSFVPADGSDILSVLTRGEPEQVDEDRAKEILSAEDFEVRIDLGLGKESARYWTCDLSYEYVRINGDYRS